ncbi:hypothetical protein N2152v2_001685 [Parachlorella kessleri]
MLTSVSNLMLDSYLPLYLSEVLALSNTEIGNLQGLAHFLARITSSLSGTLADVLSPARMVVLGTLLNTLNKPMLAFSGAVHGFLGASACRYWIALAKAFDRTSEAPQKALIGELAGQTGESPTAAFSLRQATGTLGMVVGATAASLAFQLSGRSYLRTFALATIPTVLALLLVSVAFGWRGSNSSGVVDSIVGSNSSSGGSSSSESSAINSSGVVDTLIGSNSSSGGSGSSESSGSSSLCRGSIELQLRDAGRAAASHSPTASQQPGTLEASTVDVQNGQDQPTLSLLGKARTVLSAFKPGYWEALAVVCTLFFARYDVSFVMLRAKAVMDRAQLPLVLQVSMLTTILLAPSGGMWAKASVRARNNVLLLGMAALLCADLCFAFLPSLPGILLGALLVGCHMALNQGVAQAMVSSYVPSKGVAGLGRISGTCWSFTDLLLGFVLAASNSIAGRLCDWTLARGWGNIGCFLGGACACALAMLVLLFFSTFGSLGKEPQPAAQ